VLLHQDARGERLLVVVGLNRHGRLQHDRAAVHPLVHEVHGGACDLDAVVERLPLGVQAGERREQRGMDVERPPGEGPHVDRREDPHEAGVAHQHHPPRGQLLHQLGVERLPVGEVLGIEPERLDAGGPRPLQRRRALTVGDHHRDVRRVVRPRARV
jgi:hypothetical protein